MVSDWKDPSRGPAGAILRFFSSLLLLVLCTGCASINPLADLGVGNSTPEEGRIKQLMKWHSGHAEVYDNFRTVFTARAVYLSDEIQRLAADWEIKSRLMTPKERKSFEKKFLGERSKFVSILLGFYTPQVQLNDLGDKNSSWTSYLKNADGTIVRATCLKVNDVNARPYMRFLKWDMSWSRLYLLCFPSSDVTPDAEGRITLVISGLQGQGEISMKFNPPDGEP